jgi:hypothetical protein
MMEAVDGTGVNKNAREVCGDLVTLLQQIDIGGWPDPIKLFFTKPSLKRKQAYSQRNYNVTLIWQFILTLVCIWVLK